MSAKPPKATTEPTRAAAPASRSASCTAGLTTRSMRACRAARARARARASADYIFLRPRCAPSQVRARDRRRAAQVARDRVAQGVLAREARAAAARGRRAPSRGARRAAARARGRRGQGGLVARMTASVEALETRLRSCARAASASRRTTRATTSSRRARRRAAGGSRARGVARARGRRARRRAAQGRSEPRAPVCAVAVRSSALCAVSLALRELVRSQAHTHTHRLSLAAIGAMCSAPGSR